MSRPPQRPLQFPADRLRLTPGTMGDYHALARFHYRAGPPATRVAIHALRDPRENDHAPREREQRRRLREEHEREDRRSDRLAEQRHGDDTRLEVREGPVDYCVAQQPRSDREADKDRPLARRVPRQSVSFDENDHEKREGTDPVHDDYVGYQRDPLADRSTGEHVPRGHHGAEQRQPVEARPRHRRGGHRATSQPSLQR